MKKQWKGFNSRLGNHFAGDGMNKPVHDDIDDWDTGCNYVWVKFPHEDKDEWKELSGPVITYNLKDKT